MKYYCFFLLFIVVIFSSCKNEDNKEAQLQVEKYKRERELIFSNLNKNWNFTASTLTPESKNIATNWNEWRVFTNELLEKPKSTIGAFQRKSKILVQKVDILYSTIPPQLDKPQIRARLTAIITKVKALNTFINIQKIPEKKVIDLVLDLNIEVNVFQNQIEEIVQRSHIEYEEGEQEMIQSAGGIIKNPSSSINDNTQNNQQDVPK